MNMRSPIRIRRKDWERDAVAFCDEMDMDAPTFEYAQQLEDRAFRGDDIPSWRDCMWLDWRKLRQMEGVVLAHGTED